MTKDSGQTVRLSGRDWAGLATLAVVVLGSITTQYLRHDRLLTEVLIRQTLMAERVEQVERAVERLETGAMRGQVNARTPTPLHPRRTPPMSLSDALHRRSSTQQNSLG